MRPRMLVKWCSIVHIAVPRRTSSRHEVGPEQEAANIAAEEAANIYFDEALKNRLKEARDALLKRF